MNNNIIKSLRRTLLCTVAAAAVTIGFTACADEMFETQNVTAPANGNGYKISIAANIGSGDTRAVAYNSETGGYDATFETSDGIFVYNITKNANGQKDLTPDANGKKVNLVGELSFWAWDSESQASVEIVPEVGDELILYYKCGRSINYNYLYGEIIHDYALAKVTIESINDGVIKTSAATFAHPQSLYKIKFTGIASDINIKNVIIQSKYYKLVSEYNPYYVTSDGQQGSYEFFNNIRYIYDEEGTKQHELIFSLRFSNKNSEGPSGDEISFVALGSDGHYYKGVKSVTTDLENGKYYQADVPMEDAGLALTLTNNTTGQQVEVSDWNNISTKDATYTIKDIGYENLFEWYGGNNTLTLKGVTIRSNMGCLSVYTDSSDPENTKEHYLVLDGENTLTRTSEGGQSMTVFEKSTLHISEASSGGELIVSPYMGISNNAKVILESGVVTINGYLEEYENGCFIISKGGKLRIPNDARIREGGIKAADGYALIVSQDGEYRAYTAVEDDGSGLAKSIWVTPAITIGLDSDTQGWDGDRPNVIVMPENTEDKSVTWKSSDPNIIEYANGELYPRHFGVATLTVTTNDGSNLSAECIVTVKPLAAIMYNNYEVNVTPESKPFINPLTTKGHYTSITYTSSDESIATVNASTGEVTIAAGATVGQKVQIRAHVTWKNDGEYFYPQWNETAYTVNIVAPVTEGNREVYTHDSW